jgi:GWxTD domain-containing protein
LARSLRTRLARGGALCAVSASAFGWFLAGPPSAGAFPIRSPDRPRFVVDAVAFPAGGDSIRVDISWEIPYAELSFQDEEGVYRARYDFAVVILKDGRQVTGDIWERRVRTREFSRTRSVRLLAKGRQSFHLRPGKYRVEMSLTDRTTRATSRAHSEIELTVTSARFELSDLELLRYTGEGISPNPRRDVPAGEGGHVARLEIRPGPNRPIALLVKWRYVAVGGDAVVARDTTLVPGSDPLILDIPVPALELPPGRYRLETEVIDPETKGVERRRSELQVRLTSAWLARNCREASTLLEIIATDDEAKLVRDAEGEKCGQALAAYWNRHDPSPGTPVNEYRDEIFGRVEAAASLFVEPFTKPGWRTDRGRVYVRYGAPDSRVLRDGDVGTPAAEIWEYVSPHLVLVFVDQRGVGEYWLVRGEP